MSSATPQEEDKFAVSLSEDVTIDGVKLLAGYRGRGVVQSAKKRRMMGQAGQLNIALGYIKVGDTEAELFAASPQSGDPTGLHLR